MNGKYITESDLLKLNKLKGTSYCNCETLSNTLEEIKLAFIPVFWTIPLIRDPYFILENATFVGAQKHAF